jgi:hypothetical protein
MTFKTNPATFSLIPLALDTTHLQDIAHASSEVENQNKLLLAPFRPILGLYMLLTHGVLVTMGADI